MPSENNPYIVYVHTTPNGKKYVGITSQRVERRWRGGLGYQKNEHFFRAILKYGWENIRHEIVAEGLTKEEASQKERELIAKWHTNEYEHGYNNTEGGEFGYTLTEASRESISKTLKEYYSDKTHHPMYGKGHSIETRQKLSQGRMGNTWSVRKSVLQFTTDGEFVAEYETLTAAHKATGISMASLSQCAHGVEGHATAGKYVWRFKDKDGQ